MPTETRRESMGVLESIWCPSTFLLTQGLGSAPPLHPPWVGDQLASPGLRDCRGSRPLGWVASWRDTGGVDTAPPSPSALLWAPPKLLLTLVTFPRGTSGGGDAAGTDVQGPSTFVLAKGSLFTKAWTNSSGPMCRRRSCTRRERRSRERGEGMERVRTGGLAWCSCGLPPSQPTQKGLWTPVLLTRAPQPLY